MSENGTPKVFGLLEKSWEGDSYYSVYFRPEGALYFIVFSISERNGEWIVRGCSAEPRCRLQLTIRSESLTIEEITEAVGLPPTESWNKGQARRKNIASFYKFTGWFINLTDDAPGEFDDKLKQLLEYVEPVAHRIRALNGPCTVTVMVGYQGYKDQMSGFFIESARWQGMERLGAALDVDLYASGPDLGDSTDGEGLELLSGN